MSALFDAHCHVDFALDPAQVLADAREAGLGFLAVTCEPRAYERMLQVAAGFENATLALGAHPWWVADGRVGDAELARFEELAPEAAAFGELGLDFSDKHTAPESHAAQVEAFRRACVAAAQSSRDAGIRKPLSVHSVRAADEVLDILEETGCLEACTCIFHWFSGSTPQLWRAIHAGCWFSVNEMGLRTKRGREYAKLIPKDRLLTETDLPEENDPEFCAASVVESLGRAEAMLAELGKHPTNPCW